MSGYIFATKACIDNRKKIVKQRYLLHKSSQYGESLASVREFGATRQISTSFVSWLRYCSDVAQRKSTKLCTMFGRLLSWYTIYFGGSCPLTAFCQVQNSLSVQDLRYPILVALLHSTRAVGVSPILRRGIFTRHGGHPVRHWAVELSSVLNLFTARQ